MNNFQYLQPRNLKEASSLLGKDFNEVIPFGGGTDALGLMKDAVISPKMLVNLKSLPGMREISYKSGQGLKIGALATISEIAAHSIIREKYKVLHEAANVVASPQLRNIGTLGGNLCQRPRCPYYRGEFECIRKGGDLCYAIDGHNKLHCIVGGGPCFIVHPSDMAVALLALDAKVTIFSGKKSRTIPLADFFVLPEQDFRRENILQPGEIVTEIQVPELPVGTRTGYVKFKEREAWDFAMVSVAAVVEKRGGSIIRSGRIAFGGVAPVPWQETALNNKLAGLTGDADSISQAASWCFQDAEPLAMNAYKVPLARTLVKRLLSELMS